MSVDKTKFYKCFIPTCKFYVDHGKMMCVPHWRDVPQEVKTRLGEFYISGQFKNAELTSDLFLDATRDAINAIAEIEKKNESKPT